MFSDMTSLAFMSGNAMGSVVAKKRKKRKTDFFVSAHTTSRNKLFHLSAWYDLSPSEPLPCLHFLWQRSWPYQSNALVALFICDPNRFFLGFVSKVVYDGSHRDQRCCHSTSIFPESGVKWRVVWLLLYIHVLKVDASSSSKQSFGCFSRDVTHSHC